MGFKAEEVVEPLDYDFNPYVPKTGRFPEPSGDQVETFRNAVVAAMGAAGLDDLQAQADAGTLKVSSDLLSKVFDAGATVEVALTKAVADLSGGEITVTDLMNLPHRVRQAFLGWITGAFISPEA